MCSFRATSPANSRNRPLDRRVYVLVGESPGELSSLDFYEHRFEAADEVLRLLSGDYALLPEHPGVGD